MQKAKDTPSMRRMSAPVSTSEGLKDFADAPVEILPKEVNLTGEADDKLPNTLVITVIQARNLQPATLRSTLSCYVKLTSLGREYKTSVMTKTDEPCWNETFNFRAVDWASSVTLSVRDKINVKMRVLGQVRISSVDIANLPGMTCQSWFRLLDKNWEKKPGLEAELELKIAMIYTKKNDPSISSELAALKAEQEDEIIGIIVDQDEETEEEALARRRELERQEKERANTIFSNLKQGDYQIQVHVIEARDLKGENLSGTSDPYCQVEVMGMKKKTSTKYDTLGCVFDEILFFHFKNIGRNEIRNASIKLAIFDKEMILKDKFIGAYQLDCLSVYLRPHHELYRQWVAVHDHLSEKDRGIQGFLLVSITVIGPGDSMLIHDREAEIAKALAASGSMAISSPDNQSLVLLPPSIDLKLQFLLIKVLKAEDLPAMDEGGLMMTSGIDAFIQIGFATNSACKSSVVTVKGNTNLCPEFLEEMWIPVMIPTLSRNIAISVWDRDFGRKDELVGITSYDFHKVVSATSPGGSFAIPEAKAVSRNFDTTGEEEEAIADIDKVELRWYNLYGPPLRRVNKKRADAISHNPEFGSTYRGRVLLSMERVESPMPSEGEKFHTKRMKETMTAYEVRFPNTVKYVLRAALYCGVDIPQFHFFGTSTIKMRITISIGSYDIHFDAQSVNKDGRVNWEECKERWPIILPADLTQLPDIIITLNRQVDKDTFVSVSYERFVASDVFRWGFTSKCRWIALKEEVSRRQTKYALDKMHSPGIVLVRMGFGREEVAVRHPWDDDTLFTPFRHHMVHREIRVHIFQFRNLALPEGKIRLPNPFVTVKCCGQVKKTAPQYKTLDPLFYETLVFVVYVPQDVVFSPDIVFHLHDANVSTSTNVPTGMIGQLRLSMAKSVKTTANANAPRPSWYSLQSQKSVGLFIDAAKGEALISVQHIDHKGPVEHLVNPDPIRPEYEEATLEIVALGVRKLKALSVLGVQSPYAEFELVGGMFADGSIRRKTKHSTSSNGKNANFLDHLVVQTKFPVDTVFAPQLRIKICESSLGGLRKTTIASCMVDLSKKLPWSPDYLPPEQEQAFKDPTDTPTLKTKDDKGSKTTLGSMIQQAKRQRKTLVVGEGDEGNLASQGAERSGSSDDLDEEVVDDGVGIGDISITPLMPLTLSASFRKASQSRDPAIVREMQKEEQRRYNAARADLVYGGFNRSLGSQSRSSQDKALHEDPREVDSHSTTNRAPYLNGRDWWITDYGGEELEQFLKVKALESYPLYRPVLTRPSLLKGKQVRVELKSGVFKGLISVVERKKKQKDARPSSLFNLERFREPQAVVVRIYVLRGSNLQSKNRDGYSDPYLRIKLGKHIISDRANYKKKTLNPEFFRVFSMNTSLPGPSQLEMSVWDYDLINDNFIGSTMIDLEDRWFHKEWQHIGHGHPKLQEAGGCLKPIEYRHLYTPKRSTPQGFLQLWIDILPAQQASLVPPVSIEPPAPKKFEIRLIVWRGENITDKDQSEINDYFVKVWMEGGKAESTDVHWRCSNGKPCWNWRFKLPVEYPLRTAEFGRLHIQLWDKDVLKWNDVIGEAQLDLYKWLRRAYESNRTVSPFLELKEMAKATSLGMLSADTNNEAVKEQNEEKKLQEEDWSDHSDAGSVIGIDDEVNDAPKENDALLKDQQRKAQSNRKHTTKKPAVLVKPSATDLKKAKKAKEEAEAKAALNGILDFLGLGNLPDDAEWITMYYTDRESAVSLDMGRIGISMQIVPEQEALANPVGKGHEAPNMNPYLPPPVGRMQMSANPLLMLKELVGPKMCLRITILCTCAGCILFISVFGATIMSTLTYLQAMSQNNAANAREPLPFNG